MDSACYSIYQPNLYNHWGSLNLLCYNILENLGYKLSSSDITDNQNLVSVFVRKDTTVEIVGERHVTINYDARSIASKGYTDTRFFVMALLELVAQNVFFTVQDETQTTDHYVVRDLTDSEIIDTIGSRLGGDEFYNVYYFNHSGEKVIIRE